MNRTDNTQIMDLGFESLADFGRFLKETPNNPEAARESIACESSADWDLNTNLEAATEMLERGGHWPEGAKEMRKAHIDASRVVSGDPLPEIDFDVTGHTLDVPTFLSGDPEYFQTDSEEESIGKPTIRFGCSVSRSWSMETPEIVRRGAAVMSLIDSLEEQGFRCEVWAVCDSHANGVANHVHICLKHGQDPWAPSVVAFGLCHPAFYRRLCFAATEKHPDRRAAELTRACYGSSGQMVKDSGAYDLYFPRMADDKPWRSAEVAAKTVMDQWRAYTGAGQ